MVAEKLIGNKIRPRTVIMKLYIESVMNESLRDREVSLCVVLSRDPWIKTDWSWTERFGPGPRAVRGSRC